MWILRRPWDLKAGNRPQIQGRRAFSTVFYTVLIVVGAGRCSSAAGAALEDSDLLAGRQRNLGCPFVVIFILLLVNRKDPDGGVCEYDDVQHCGVDHSDCDDRSDGFLSPTVRCSKGSPTP